jgi:molybdopterin-containing oxidoreductase family iron-sulfur binding subunit
MSEDHTLDLAAIRARLSASRGREAWRSLEELADSPGFQEIVQREFPSRASEWLDPVGRRSFLKLMGASIALAGVTACTRQPIEQIVPYVTQPEEVILGKPLYFATAMTLGGVSTGVLVKSNEGRPTKIEGNVFHPESQGATSVFAQGSVLSLYDPDRAQTVTYLGDTRSWNNFVGAIQAVLQAKKGQGGAGLRLLTETVCSPTLAEQFKDLLAVYPQARWHQYEQTGREHVREGAKLAFGRYVDTQYHFDKADVIVSLGADFLSGEPGTLRQVRDFSTRRRVTGPDSQMNRLYVVEPMLTNTGAMADHRWPLRPSQIAAFASALASAVGVAGASAGGALPDDLQKHLSAIVQDLQAHKGSSIVVAGNEQSPELHALAHAINAALGNVGTTVTYTEPIDVNPVNQIESLRELAADMDAGKVDLLIILGGNPVYNAPADLNFAEKLQKVALRVHLASHFNETSGACHWHVPESHYLEAWSDGRAFDGTVSIVQPLIAPLYDSKSAHEMLVALSDSPSRTAYDVVRGYWARQFRARQAPAPAAAQPRGQGPGQAPAAAAASAALATPPLGPTAPAGDSPFDLFWRKVLNDGVMPDTAFPPITVSLTGTLPALPQTPAGSDALEFVYRLDPTTYDGRFANNGWLQELPKPITRLTWDNAVLLSPATAERLGIGLSYSYQGGEHGQAVVDVVELTLDGRKVTAPVWIMPGQADNCATLYLGYGRTGAGNVGNHTGYNANAIRSTAALWSGAGLSVRKVSESYGQQYHLATVQDHFSMQGRGFVQVASIEEFRRNPEFAAEGSEPPAPGMTMYNPQEFPYNDYKWSMAIDLNACTGCGACVIACVAENNIAVVGKDQVMAGREMHWIRVDRYFEGSLENPTVYNQPVPCQQCENAPCELVCPVGATVHSAEGLNDMVYNRCVGTRYCSNNCPYKVRRFNFLLYQDWETQPLRFVRNPDVTVRSRGVMEKCTYCVQRIQEAKIDSEKQNRKVRDGEIVTACQAACPAEAIVFGDANDKSSKVAALKAQSRNYGLLAELNTHPRTTYLAALRNPNPAIAPLAAAVTNEG